MSIHATNTPAVAMEAAYTMAGSGVVPHLDHSRGPAYYPLDKCPRAVLEFDMIGCCCNTAQPIDYRLRTREVTVDIAWRGDPVANSWLYEPSASDDDDYHYRRRAYYDTPLTDCNLLKQVLHVELETLRLVFPFSLLQVKAPALILPKLPEDFILPQSFRMTLEIHRVKEPSGAKLGEIRREFAEHFGVNETQVTIELQHLRLYNPSWWSSELSDALLTTELPHLFQSRTAPDQQNNGTPQWSKSRQDNDACSRYTDEWRTGPHTAGTRIPEGYAGMARWQTLTSAPKLPPLCPRGLRRTPPDPGTRAQVVFDMNIMPPVDA
ncbi:hypothetical protein A1Q2_00585 [Trichosporon asahii var. asahii CBS 8904]|uniref:Uncharacterized protein n=2 Tax=Trichosporon asahii var. asahii TaxID=189963 RepID=K1WWN4_TRIAC|nr:hypothetical protein A1Q1_03791 [Trichosporon asahii var. asahii CBS 2479]EJT52510.1 hypothetical protein A1Q1_03791 [Trichosporon asahii var. asahii CBS 2479]EKD05119.1 hypothetical protein A1Q2_00585 [Trichosporon asahii var. asahii CBS 8904]